MNAETHNLKQWVNAESYAICVHALKDVVVSDTGISVPAHVRSVRVLVEYANNTAIPFRFFLHQWLLFDTDNFAYEFEIRNQFYEEDAIHKLKEGTIQSGQKVKGWVAFQVPEKARLSHIQFQMGYPSNKSLTIQL
jgi:hypothetical protein